MVRYLETDPVKKVYGKMKYQERNLIKKKKDHQEEEKKHLEEKFKGRVWLKNGISGYQRSDH